MSKGAKSSGASKRMTDASSATRKYARTILKSLGTREAANAVAHAIKAVLSDKNVRRERVRIYGPLLRIEKPKRRSGAPSRLIWVRLRDRDRQLVHEISIANGRIVEHRIDAGANPSFSSEEREDARRLISNDSELHKVVKRKDVEISWFCPAGHEPGRFIGARIVRVRNHQVVEHIATAEIDLDAGVLLNGRIHK